MERKNEKEAVQGLPRITKQRRAIFAALQGDTSHPTAEEVYLRVKEQLPHISLATVYRNLKLLARQGLIREISMGEGPHRYDFQTHEHSHFRCDRCGQVFDVELNVPQQLNRELSRRGFQVRSQELVFYGLCSDCSSASAAD